MRIHSGNLCSRHSRKMGRPAGWILLFWRCVCVAEPADVGKHVAVALGALKTAWLAGRNAPVGSALGRWATEGEPRGRGCGAQGLFLWWLLLRGGL